MPVSTVIEVDQLNVRYGEFHAVKDLSFQVARGELYALLGTNGAGKTSTLEVIEGHRTASTGTARVFGKSPTDRRAVRPRMGIMLQESGFAADLTVAESVRLIGRLSRRRDTVARVLDLGDLAHRAGTRVAQLSGGEKRRLDFATAVYGRPELIVLDEPTTGLDIQSRDALWETVRRLREDGATVVLTTHYLEEAQQRADRIGLMHEGVFRRQGTVAELIQTLPASIRFRCRRAPRHCRCDPRRWPTGPTRSTRSTCSGISRRYLTGRTLTRSSSPACPPHRPGWMTSSVPSAPNRSPPDLEGLLMLPIAKSELSQLFRNRAVLITSLIMPVAASIFFIGYRDTFSQIGSLGYVAAVLVFTIAAFGLYATTVTTLAARRQNLFLKRLRSTAAGDATILTGLVLPVSVIAIVQVGVILVVFAGVGRAPVNPVLLVAALAATLAMMLAFAIATAGVTNSPEHAQVTTLPLSLGVIAVASWVGITGTESLAPLKRILPGGSATELVVNAWNGGVPLSDSMLLLAPTLVWVAVAVGLATRMFRWEPRR